MDRQRIFFVGVVALCLWVLHPIAMPLAVGAVLAFVLEDPQDFLFHRFPRLRQGRAPSLLALFLVLITSGLFLIPLGALGTVAVMEGLRSLSALSHPDSSAGPTQGFTDSASAWFERALTDLGSSLGVVLDPTEIWTHVRSAFASGAQLLLEFLGGLVTSTPHLFLFVFLMCVSWWVFLVHGRTWRARFLPALIPWERERAILCETTASVLKAIIVASVVISLAQSLLITAILGAVRIPRFWLWGAVGFFASFVPVFGTAPIMLGASLWLWGQGRPVAAFCVGMGALLVGLVDNFLRPFVMKGGVELNFFWIFLALMGGIGAFGVAGAVIGPLAFSLCLASLRSIRVGGNPPT